MKAEYKDIIAAAGKPWWWSESGVPRYCDFAPHLAHPEAMETALVEINCQGCGEEYKVAVSTSSRAEEQLSVSIRQAQRVGYGDPPAGGCCAAGDTMTAEEIQVIEFWSRNNKKFEWRRDKSLEVRLIDGALSDEAEWAMDGR